MKKEDMLDNAIQEIERVLIGNKSKDVEEVYLRNAIRFIKQTKPEIKKKNKRELSKIPGYVAEYIEFCKKHGWTLSRAINHMSTLSSNVHDYLHVSRDSRENQETFARAWLFGYDIEQPKTLQVIVKNCDSTAYKTNLPEDEAMKLIDEEEAE